MKIAELIKKVEDEKVRGKFAQGVKEYALEMLTRESIDPSEDADTLNAGTLLNHVGGNMMKIGMFHSCQVESLCHECSWGGNFEIYSEDIANKLCSKSCVQRKMRKDGALAKPNAREDWRDLQARAVRYALVKIQRLARG